MPGEAACAHGGDARGTATWTRRRNEAPASAGFGEREGCSVGFLFSRLTQGTRYRLREKLRQCVAVDDVRTPSVSVTRTQNSRWRDPDSEIRREKEVTRGQSGTKAALLTAVAAVYAEKGSSEPGEGERSQIRGRSTGGRCIPHSHDEEKENLENEFSVDLKYKIRIYKLKRANFLCLNKVT